MRIYVANVKELKNEALFTKLYNLVDDERRNKIDRYKFMKDKILSLGSGILLRLALLEQGFNPMEVNFGYNKFGKPYLLENEKFCFSLSHSGEMVMCSVSSCDVGCDVEKVTNIDLEIAKNYFYLDEFKLINRQESKDEKYDMFFRLWTLKESFMKITGLGMSLPLDAFQIKIRDNEIVIKQDFDNREYYFKEYNIDKDYKFSCCSVINAFPKNTQFVDIKSIV